jgi:hypothetical protein
VCAHARAHDVVVHVACVVCDVTRASRARGVGGVRVAWRGLGRVDARENAPRARRATIARAPGRGVASRERRGGGRREYVQFAEACGGAEEIADRGLRLRLRIFVINFH